MVTSKEFLALKEFKLKDKLYKPGNPVDVKNLPDTKINQLLDQRWIRPKV